MSERRLALVVYRSLLRWSRANRDVPFSLRPSDVRSFAPIFFIRQQKEDPLAMMSLGADPASSYYNGAKLLSDIVRSSFRQYGDSESLESRESINRGIEALRSLNTFYSTLLGEARAARAEHVDRTGIEFCVGQTFIHKKYGYRGVIYGWDRKCQRDRQWIEQMQADAESPHYMALPDEADCVRLFGGVRLTKYVGQKNIEPLEGVHRIVHRAIDHYFEGQNGIGLYVPRLALQYEYPNDRRWEQGRSSDEMTWRLASSDADVLHEEETCGSEEEKMDCRKTTREDFW